MSGPRLLDYHPVEPLRRSTVRIGTLLGFSIAFAMSMLAALNLRGLVPWSLHVTGVVTLFTALVFVVTTILRRSCARPPCHYRGMMATLAVGAGCVVVPTILRWVLLGFTETLPWVLAAWLVMTIGASFIVYASYAGRAE